jgi:hypothetical protein
MIQKFHWVCGLWYWNDFKESTWANIVTRAVSICCTTCCEGPPFCIRGWPQRKKKRQTEFSKIFQRSKEDSPSRIQCQNRPLLTHVGVTRLRMAFIWSCQSRESFMTVRTNHSPLLPHVSARLQWPSLPSLSRFGLFLVVYLK